MTSDERPVTVIYHANGIKTLTEIEAAYLAGVIDGEGTITISRKRDQKGVRGGYSYRPYVNVTNTCRQLPAWVQAATGVGRMAAAKAPRPGHKQAWRWEVWSQKAGAVLVAVRPYLVVKGDQADLLLAFTRQATRRPGRDGLTHEERRFQIETYEQLKALNQRGTL